MDVTFLVTILLAGGIVGQPSIADTTPGCPMPVVMPAPVPYVHHHASTAAEGWLQGRADLARAAGWYNYLTSQGMVYQQQAQTMALENSKLATATYFERRQINHEARYPRKIETQAMQTVKMRSTKPSLQLFDATTGEVAWPAGLTAEEFAAGRSQIEALLKTPAEASSNAAARRTGEVRQIVAEMRAELETQVRTLPPMEYVEAKRFLLALAGQNTVGNGLAHDSLATNP